MAEVAPFPWAALERLTRREIEAVRRTRQTWAGELVTADIAAALTSLVSAPVELSVSRLGVSPSVPAGTVDVWLTPDGDRTRLYVAMEPGLVAVLVGALLGRSAVAHRPDYPPTAELVGAGSALLVAVLRRATSHPWRLSASRSLPDALWVDVVALAGDQVYSAYLAAPVPRVPPPPRPFDRQLLALLGEVPIELSVVVAVGTVGREELSLLEPGAAWVPGGAWTAARDVDGHWTGSAILAAGPSETGIPITFDKTATGPTIVVSTGKASLPWVVPEGEASPREGEGERAVDPTDTVTDALEGAPVVLRIEVGTVTLTAAEWARLAVGDVIGTGLRLGEPVTLRAGGAVYGRGELCEVEGELAVRLLTRGERLR